MDPSARPIDPEFIGLACQMAGCEPDHLLAVRWENEELYVVVAGHPSYLFTAQQIYEAGQKYVATAIALGLHGRPPEGWYDQHVRPARPAAVEPEPAPARKSEPAIAPGSGTGEQHKPAKPKRT